jgi:methylmalonyl-CoA/ethylmalonyl-CoA epimerase
MSRIKKIDHVAIVVEDIEEALEFWHDILGLELSHVEDVPEEDSVVAFLPASESEVELVRPTTGASGVARYLKKQGPGMHHICFEVYDIEETLAHLKKKGVRLINEVPQIGTAGKKIAFVHPESTHGVLVELYELTAQEPQIRLARARLLADRVLIGSQNMAGAALDFLNSLRRNDPED